MIIDDVFIGLIAKSDTDYFLHNKDIFTYMAETGTEPCSMFLKYIEFLVEGLNTVASDDNIRLFFRPFLEERGVTGLISEEYVKYVDKVIETKVDEETVVALKIKLAESYGVRKVRNILERWQPEIKGINQCDDILKEIEEVYHNPVITGKPEYIDYFSELEWRHAQAQEEEYMKVFPTGYTVLDEYLKIRSGHITTVCAPPKVGKSTFLRSLAINQAKMKFKVGYASLEENAEEVQRRFDSGFASEEICPTGMTQSSYVKKILEGAENKKRKGLLYIKHYPTGSVKIDQIFTDLKKSGLDVDIMYVDYPFLAKKEDPNSYENGDILFTKLRYWADTLDIPIVVAHQQTRKAINNIFAGESETGDSLWILRHSYNLIYLQQDTEFYSKKKMKYKIVQRFGESQITLISDTQYALSRFPNMQKFDISMLTDGKEEKPKRKSPVGKYKLGGG